MAHPDHARPDGFGSHRDAQHGPGAAADPPVPCQGNRAWRSFARAHALVTRRVEADLLAAHRLSLVSFEVLECLGGAPGGRVRMAALAEQLVVSRSGVTRAVDRLARQGLVTRQPCDSDLRGTYAALTDAGRERLAAATPTHDAGVRYFLIDPLGGREQAFADALEPVMERAATV